MLSVSTKFDRLSSPALFTIRATVKMQKNAEKRGADADIYGHTVFTFQNNRTIAAILVIPIFYCRRHTIDLIHEYIINIISSSPSSSTQPISRQSRWRTFLPSLFLIWGSAPFSMKKQNKPSYRLPLHNKCKTVSPLLIVVLFTSRPLTDNKRRSKTLISNPLLSPSSTFMGTSERKKRQMMWRMPILQSF